MKLSNFKLVETRGKSPLDWAYYAEVDVTTGFLFWKKTNKAVTIFREYVGYYRFLKGGKHTPGHQAEDLAAAWKAQTGQNC